MAGTRVGGESLRTAGSRMKGEGETELLEAVGRVVAAFDALGVEYLVGGSIASSVFGEPRQTVDADLLARLFGRHAKPLVERLSDEFYADLPAVLAAVENQSCFNLIHLHTATKVDVFVRWRDAFGQSQLARRQRKSVGQASPLETTPAPGSGWPAMSGCSSSSRLGG